MGFRMSNAVVVRAATPSDAQAWERMRQALWPSPEGEHAREIAAFFCGDRRNPAEALIAVEDSGNAVGLAELSTRPYVEGCYSGRVAYLEGWFVEKPRRGRGIGA